MDKLPLYKIISNPYNDNYYTVGTIRVGDVRNYSRGVDLLSNEGDWYYFSSSANAVLGVQAKLIGYAIIKTIKNI